MDHSPGVDPNDPYHGGTLGIGVRRACDQCRLRKIKCDKESPCANCRIARRICSSTGLGQKPKEARQRVLISSQYERKIDMIEERLGGIEDLLRNLSSASLSSHSPASPPTRGGRSNSHLSSSPSSRRHTAHEASGTASSHSKSPAGAGQSTASGEDAVSTVFDPQDASNFEGASSTAAHAAFASIFLENEVQKTSMLHDGSASGAKMDIALASLRQIVGMQQNRRGGLSASFDNFGGESGSGEADAASLGEKHLHKMNLRDLPLPPMALVVEKLKEMKNTPAPPMLTVVSAFIDAETFADRCRRVYFSTEEPTESAFVLVNSGLITLFFEASLEVWDSDPVKRAEYEACTAMCQNNLEVALAQMPLMMPATLENAEALLNGATFSVEVSRPSLAWLLTSRAVHMCRALGLHDISSMANDSPAVRNHKTVLFWSAYLLDRGLSLRLGRASILQDYDINVPQNLDHIEGPFPAKEMFTMWIGHASCQGRIYERLYSPGALRQPEASRIEHVRALAMEQQELIAQMHAVGAELSRRREADNSSDTQSRIFQQILRSDEIGYYSALTLIYRALPPAPGSRSRTFADECCEAAYASIRVHLEVVALMGGQNSMMITHLHWTVLYAPFIPFIVIFCLLIETCSDPMASHDVSADLQLMSDFVKSLEAAIDFSPSVSRLHRLCQVLHNVASLYVESKAQQSLLLQQQQQQHQAHGNNFMRSSSSSTGASPHGAGQDASSGGDIGGIPLDVREFDMYLSQLGFMPGQYQQQQQQQRSQRASGTTQGADQSDATMVGGGGGAMEGMVQSPPSGLQQQQNPASMQQQQMLAPTTNQLGDWFSGNNYMLGLLEEDLSGIPTFNWTP
ncbi:hypothetical protein Micbo1qcDRAFT_235197 [Microdochium bolleyi]|uniref:Zn(2)-C6 fungal-type domain-containing protein n=1 Tax=Microdochium bolleyi TaxID=196109 RepID=A0A136IWT5_9PEZI|nr:hypothetical protein Micbo1qcDRAFT_235197 [Microdochium bolleyi]